MLIWYLDRLVRLVVRQRLAAVGNRQVTVVAMYRPFQRSSILTQVFFAILTRLVPGLVAPPCRRHHHHTIFVVLK